MGSATRGGLLPAPGPRRQSTALSHPPAPWSCERTEPPAVCGEAAAVAVRRVGRRSSPGGLVGTLRDEPGTLLVAARQAERLWQRPTFRRGEGVSRGNAGRHTAAVSQGIVQRDDEQLSSKSACRSLAASGRLPYPGSPSTRRHGLASASMSSSERMPPITRHKQPHDANVSLLDELRARRRLSRPSRLRNG
jgi:hypothetical protein